jgi:hypothetical protein
MAGDPMKDGMTELTLSLKNWDTDRAMRIKPSLALPNGWSATEISAEELVLEAGQSTSLTVKASGPKLPPFVPNIVEVNLKTEWGKVSAENKVIRTFGQGDWYVIGPFGKDDAQRLNTVYPPEKEVRLDAAYKTGDGELRWKRVSSPVHPICFIEHIGGYENVVVYAYTEIMSEGERDVTCRMGTDDGAKLFLNGRQVFSHDVARSFAPDQEVFPLRLRNGRNTFLVKVSNGLRHWGFSLELTGAALVGALPGNRALHFHGGEHHVAVAPAKSLENTSSFSVEAWVNVEDYDKEGNSNLVDTLGSSYVFGLYKGKPNAGFWHEKKWHFVETPSIITTGVWTHLALTWDGTNLRLYLQDAQVASKDCSGAVPAPASNGLKLGGSKYAGMMDEVRLWNVALSGSQIRDRMNKRLSGNVPGLCGCWSFDEAEGPDIRDASGNNNHGKLQVSTGIGPPPPTRDEEGAPLSADEKH